MFQRDEAIGTKYELVTLFSIMFIWVLLLVCWTYGTGTESAYDFCHVHACVRGAVI